MNQKRSVISILAFVFMILAIIQPALADPANPPPPPPPDPPGDPVQRDYTPVTTIKSCTADFDASTNTLEYCNEPHRQTTTKNIQYCDDNNNGQRDPGEAKGTFSDPIPDQSECANGGSYDRLKTEQRTYRTCGQNDAETSNPNKTTTVDESEWFCPSAKALSMRHRPGNLDAGIGVSGAGYSDLETMSYRSESNMSYNILAAVPACVNRVPMIKADVTMNDDYSGETVVKSGVYANHMNLYYGPGGSKGKLKEVELPDQDSFRRQYDVQISSDTYRMWAWRQRFAGAVQESVDQQNLELPDDVSVDDIAKQYRDSGKSVGDLWLSSDFLYGAEAGDPTTRQVVIERQINSTCTQDVGEISERNFGSAEEFVSFTENNEEEAIDILGKSGGNYCNMGSNETLQDIRDVEKTGSFEQNYEDLTGTISTKLLDNQTEQVEAEVNVTDLDTTFLNSEGSEEEVTTSSDFIYYVQNDEESANQQIIESKSDWITSKDMSIREVTGVSDVEYADSDRTEDIDAEINVTDLQMTFVNSSGSEEDLTTADDFLYYLNEEESSAKQELVDSRGDWITSKNFREVTGVSGVKDIDSADENSTNVVFTAQIENSTNVVFTADISRWMNGTDFGKATNDEIYRQLEDNVFPPNQSVDGIMNPQERFENKMVTVDGVLSTSRSDTYEGELEVQTVENVARDKVYIYNTYRKEELEKNSWNWRALQGLTMTTLAKCLYNWDQCMDNGRNLPNRGWSGTEVFDAGYGPWEQTSTFNWSSNAAANKGENLQDMVDDTDFYNQDVDVSFDKYYDGARGSSIKEAVPVNVYRKCESDQGWRSAEGEFYPENHFICPDSDTANKGESASSSTVYRCGVNSAQLPVEKADEYDGRKIDGNWYVCRDRDTYEWQRDQNAPDLYVQQYEQDETTFAGVACSDDVATCDESTYRMKIYQPGEQPAECPEDYSEYDVTSETKEIGTQSYVCAAGMDKVNKVGFTPEPVQVGDEETQKVETTLQYPSSTMKIPYGRTNSIFYTVENQAEEYREVTVSLEGVNATFTDGTVQKDFRMVEGESKDLEIKLKPAIPGDGSFWIETQDNTVGYQLNNSIRVNSPSSLEGAAQTESREVPGIGLVQVMVLTLMSMA